MKNSIPEKIKVAGIDVGIEQWDGKHLDDVSQVFGAFTAIKSTICIHLTGNKLTDLDTLLHEIFHAIHFIYNIHDDDDEERSVTVLGTAWVQVLRDNPDLRKCIERCVK